MWDEKLIIKSNNLRTLYWESLIVNSTKSISVKNKYQMLVFSKLEKIRQKIFNILESQSIY